MQTFLVIEARGVPFHKRRNPDGAILRADKSLSVQC
jgi:hypothetical protein